MTERRKQFDQTFEIIASDPSAWLEQAQGMKIAAEPILQSFREILDVPQTLPGVRLKKLAYIDAYMLLIGFAFENLLKAIAVSRGLLTLRNKQLRFDPMLSHDRGGHSLTGLASSLHLQLTSQEHQYFERLEEFIYWAGRYPVSMKSGTYADSHSAGRLSVIIPTDPEMSDKLFDKLSKLINNHK
jgi:hypothetical protein